MQETTRQHFNTFRTKMAATYGVQSVENFTLTPPCAVKLNDKIQASADFLKRIQVVPTLELVGQIFDLDIGETIATRTKGTRKGKTIGAKNGRTFECKKTNFDVSISYEQLDTMAVFPDFNTRLVNAVNTRIALDRLLIGFNGKSCAETSNSETNKALEDMNIGWIQDLKNSNAAHFIDAATIGKASDADYVNLDQVVGDLIRLIPVEHRTGLVCLVGNELIADDMARVYAQFGTTPSEKEGFKVAGQRYGNLETITPAGFPERAVMVVNPKHLQLYVQSTSVRKKVVDEPQNDAIAHYTSMCECYRIAHVDGAACVAELTQKDI